MKVMMTLTLMVGMFVAAVASAAPLPIPDWKEGKHVYVVPEGWRSSLFGPRDIAELEREAAALKYPFYIVITEKLTGGGDADRLAAVAVDSIAQQWAARGAGYDVSTSQVFLLSFQPRKYRFLAGARWKNELGFERNAHQPHTQLFERSVRGTPKDPKGGMIAMMKSIDAYLVDQTDPVRIAARQEAARRAAEARRVRDARGALDAKILALSGLLSEKESLLPADSSSYRDLLSKAKEVRQADDPAQMTAFAATMTSSIDVLSEFVDERKSEARTDALVALSKALALLLFLGITLFLFVRRVRHFRRLKEAFATAFQEWSVMVTNASAKYLAFHGELTDMTSYLELEGETKKLSDAVAAEVNEVFYAVKAMESHIQRCSLLAPKAGFFNLKPLEDAHTNLGGEFEFDTGVLDKKTLFGGETKVLKVVPKTFADELEGRFTSCMTSWKRLKDATELWNVPTKTLFPHELLDSMIDSAKERDIPLLWLDDHPLFGDDASDQAIYDHLDRLNSRDPVAFARHLQELKDKEVGVSDRFAVLSCSVDKVAKARTDTPVTDHGIVLDPDDDPLVTYEKAVEFDSAVTGALAARRDVEEVSAKADTACGLYARCREQAAIVACAKDAVEEAASDAEQTAGDAASRDRQAQQTESAARRVHVSVDVSSFFSEGQLHADKADILTAEADQNMSERRLVQATRLYGSARAKYDAATASFSKVIAHCAALDAKKAEYERMLAGMDAKRQNAERSIRKHNGSPSRLSSFSSTTIDGPADYTTLTASLVATQESWAGEERRVRQVWQAEQDRIRREREAAERRRREEERQRRRRREAEAARRRRNSSSGGSFGGGGSSSSGGSWGGGGSSSSGGDW